MEQLDELELPMATVRLVPDGWRESDLGYSMWWDPPRRTDGITSFAHRGGAGTVLHAVDVVDHRLHLFGAYQVPPSDALDVSPDEGRVAIALWRPNGTSAIGILDPAGNMLVRELEDGQSALALTWHEARLLALIALDDNWQELRVLDAEARQHGDAVPITVATCDGAWIRADEDVVVVVGHCGCQDHEVEITRLSDPTVAKLMCPEGASVLAFDDDGSIWLEERASRIVQRAPSGEELHAWASPGPTLLEGAVVTEEELIVVGLGKDNGLTVLGLSKDDGEARPIGDVEGDARLRDDGTIVTATKTHARLWRL